MVKAYAGLAAGLLLMLPAACTNLTEYDASYQAGLYLVSAPGLTVAASTGPITGGRSVCQVPDAFWVATTEGIIQRYDTTLQLESEWRVGQPSPSAYSEMVFSPMENSVYVTGPYGSIVEVTSPEGEIQADFTPCEAPTHLLVDDDGPFMYLVDGATDRLLEIRLETNNQSRVAQLYAPALCLCNSETRDDTLVLGTTEGTELISAIGSGILRQWRFDDSLIVEVTGIPGDSIHCGVLRMPDGDRVVTLRSFFPDSMWSSSGWTGAASLQGDVHFLCPGTDGLHAYVLSYLGNSTSRLISYNHKTYSIDGTLEIPGYPVDMEATSGGNLVILTVR